MSHHHDGTYRKRHRRQGHLLAQWARGVWTFNKLFWQSSEPLPSRIPHTFRNLVRRLEILDTCCGNYGEPGC